MRDYSLFLRILAERVYEARATDLPIRDTSDFHAWLVELSEIADNADTPQEFFEQI